MVNSHPITGLTQEDASRLVIEAGDTIKLTVTRDLGVYSISSQLVNSSNNKMDSTRDSSSLVHRQESIEDAYDEVSNQFKPLTYYSSFSIHVFLLECSE